MDKGDHQAGIWPGPHCWAMKEEDSTGRLQRTATPGSCTTGQHKGRPGTACTLKQKRRIAGPYVCCLQCSCSCMSTCTVAYCM